ncbi:MAG TPA: 3-phosphoshikimate 1-carboxyvinyltransferase [Pyrinomonadaceae bacterium]
MRIQPARRLRGRFALPGDKSISHRAAMMAALSGGRSRIKNYATSEDCARTLSCLSQLGAVVERDGASVLVTGVGERGLSAPAEPLDCGNSGSTIRMMAGVLAGQEFASTLTGDDSLRARPMRRVIEPLELMGARISSQAGRAPLEIMGRRPLLPVTYEMPVASAQVKSCILLAGLMAEGRTSVIERGGPTRDHTERMLGWFGVPVETTRYRNDPGSVSTFSVEGPAQLLARDGTVPGDISSAVFFMAAAAILPGSELEITGVGLNPTRARVLETFRALGADVRVTDATSNEGLDEGDFNEPSGDLKVIGLGAGSLSPLEDGRSNLLSGALIAQLIDELPMLAVLGTQVEGGLTIRDASELRVKETDRISATVANLRAMGAEVEEYEDGLAVAGQTRLRGARLDARGDHRIAMASAVAALVADGESEIEGAQECVGVSFPEFFRVLESVIER